MQNPRRKACATSRSAALPEGRSGADPVPPGLLRLIKEGIRFRNQLFQVFMAGFLGDSETCREDDFFACGRDADLRDGFFQALCHGDRGLEFRFGKQEEEFFSAPSGHDVPLPCRMGQSPGRGHQRCIACGMAMTVVDRFEMVEVEYDYGQFPSVAP